VQLEYLLEAADLLVGFPQVLLQPALELGVARILDHLRQRHYNLLFRIIDVVQPVLIEISEAVNVF